MSSDHCLHSDHSVDPLETKVLKCDQQVPVSRSASAKLFINNKKISRDQGKFIIGAHSDDDIVCLHRVRRATLSLSSLTLR